MLYTVTANPIPLARTGVVSVAGQFVTIVQAAAPCAYGISPATRAHSSAPETGVFSVTTFSNCTWQANTTNDWISVTLNPDGAGSATIGYLLATNPVPLARTGAVMLADRTLLVTQGAAPCAFGITPPSQTHGYAMETGSVNVATFFTCAWTASTPNSWISILSGASGRGDGQLRYSVSSNAVV